MTITYREFGAELLQDVLKLYENAGWTAYLGDGEKLRRAFENSLWCLGAFEDGALVGFVRCVGDGEHIVYVQDLIVAEERQRAGIGRGLLRRAMERYEAVRMFALSTDGADGRSNGFYRALGLAEFADAGVAGYLRP